MILEVSNDAALAVWQVGKEVIGKRLMDIVPEMARQPFLELMQDVFHNGVTRYGYEAPAFLYQERWNKRRKVFQFYLCPLSRCK